MNQYLLRAAPFTGQFDCNILRSERPFTMPDGYYTSLMSLGGCSDRDTGLWTNVMTYLDRSKI